jgi:hypothetical protein
MVMIIWVTGERMSKFGSLGARQAILGFSLFLPLRAYAQAVPATSNQPATAPATPDGAVPIQSGAPAGEPVARTKPSGPWLAEQRFRKGQELSAAGRFAEACREFEESQRLEPALGTLLNLAICHERLGQMGLALREFREAEASAKAGRHSEVEALARERAEQIARELPTIEIRVDRAAASAGLSVRIDSLVLGAAEWGVPRPADPGRHVIEASSPGQPTFRREIELVRGGPPSVVLIPSLRQGGAADAGTASAGPRLGSQRVAAIVVGGVGVVGVAVGTIFGLRSISKGNDSDAHCEGNICDAAGVQLRDEALSAGTVSTVAFVGGALGLAGGAALWFTARDHESSAGVTPVIGLGSIGLNGRF